MLEGGMIETELRGLFPPDYEAAGRLNLSELMRSGAVERPSRLPDVRIEDARALQASMTSERDFLDEHGFVLLTAPSAVSDWSDPAEVALYTREVEQIIRTRLYPGRRVEVRQPPFIVRRGMGTDNPNYALGVHQDHGTTADDYQHNVTAFAGPATAEGWRSRLAEDEVKAFVVLDFWRTTNMAGPLQHMPLAFCDPTSVDVRDIVPVALEGIAPNGGVTHHVSLRYNPDQRWFHYPGMKPDEVLVFKLFQLTKGEAPQRYRACFHTAVADPATPADAEPRQSCEHRVEVMLLE
jgi:hypothetical protein